MFGEHHDLIHEFPEYKDRIHDLKVSHKHFARLFDQYHELDRQIRRIEQQVETPPDHYVEDLKKQRLLLKDELYEMLHRHR